MVSFPSNRQEKDFRVSARYSEEEYKKEYQTGYSRQESDYVARDGVDPPEDDGREFRAVYHTKCDVALAGSVEVPVRQLLERYEYLKWLKVEPDVTRLFIDDCFRHYGYPLSSRTPEDKWVNNFRKLLREMEARGEIRRTSRMERSYGFGCE